MAQGSIRKRVAIDGTISWRLRIELPPDQRTGKRRQQLQTFRTKREAEAARDRWQTQIRQGTFVTPSDMTVRELLWKWYDTKQFLKPSTLDDYEVTLRVHLVPNLGHIVVQKLTTETLETFYTEKRKAGAGRRVVEVCHRRMASALQLAVRWKIVSSNIALGAQLPDIGEARPEMRTWTLQEARRFLAVADQSHRGPIWIVLLGTGMRIGEVEGIRWCDVDEDEKTLRVVQAVEPVRGRPTIQETPKTDSSRRTIPVEPEIIEALRKHRASQNEMRQKAGTAWQDNDLVFAAANGNPLRHAGLDRDYAHLIRLACVPRITVHELRHTYASRALEAGVPLEVVSKLLGHADVGITARIYAHITIDMQRKGARAAGSAFFGTARRQRELSCKRSVLAHYRQRSCTRRAHEAPDTTMG